MITPRRTRLVRAPDLHAFRGVIADLSGHQQGELDRVRSRLVVVPTRGAARQLRRTLEDRALLRAERPADGAPRHVAPAGRAARAPAASAPEHQPRVIVMPDFVTRDQLYDRLHDRLPSPPRRLTPYERDVIARAAARDATSGGAPAPFKLRPGLIAELLRFYDQLKRQSRTVARFEVLLEEMLRRDAEYDRGAERMLQQTRFLAATFHAYERRAAGSGASDEHGLRERLMAEPALDPIRSVVVTVGDWIADPNGLFPADFDLLSRLPGVEAVDVVATDRLLASGFHQRICEWLPGIEETDASDLGILPSVQPELAVPSDNPEQCCVVSRDREEELVAIARRIKADRRDAAVSPTSLDRIAVVFNRPLPYLYLGRTVFSGAGIPCQFSDALPLAAEPFAAALDLVFEFVLSRFTRGSLVALLRSPHFVFTHDDPPAGCAPGSESREGDEAPLVVGRGAVAALDRALSDARYLGDLDRLRQLAPAWADNAQADPVSIESRARPALLAAIDAAERLSPLLTPAAASEQARRVLGFLRAHMLPLDWQDGSASRHRRARAAVLDVLERLAAAHAVHDDATCDIAELALRVRRWIEEETFVPDSGDSGLQLIDDQAARYGDFEEMAIVGVVEGEWPKRPRRNIFYPSSILASLGWPSERDRRAADETRFVELLASASRRVWVSAFTLDDEALAEPSLLVDEIGRARLSTISPEKPQRARVSVEDALSLEPAVLDPLDSEARSWAELRLGRSAGDDPAFHGQAGTQPARAWSVSAVESYVACPFVFFARHVLRLEEEPDDEEVLDPRKQGQFIHDVFQAFFDAWQASGHEAITPSNLAAAHAVFAAVVEDRLGALSETEAALERARLLGSSAAAGMGDAVLRMEAERSVPVVARLLEHPLDGEFTFGSTLGPRTLALRGKADRLDLLADGTFRVIDYKLGWPPNPARALQLPIYGLCAEQQLNAAGRLGRRWSLGEAAYIAFAGPRRVVPLFPPGSDHRQRLADAEERLVAAVDAIGRGEFPPRPADATRCSRCSYAVVCRKDYVGDV